MLAFQCKIRRLRPASLMVRQFNALVKGALLDDTSKLWLTEFLKLHFEPSAVQRYSYAARNEKYLAFKRRAQFTRHWRTHQLVPLAKPTGPFVLTGELRDSLLKRGPDSFNPRATATSKNTKVKIPLRLPHPIPARNVGELTFAITAETKALKAATVAGIKRRLQTLAGSETTTVGSSG